MLSFWILSLRFDCTQCTLIISMECRDSLPENISLEEEAHVTWTCDKTGHIFLPKKKRDTRKCLVLLKTLIPSARYRI